MKHRFQSAQRCTQTGVCLGLALGFSSAAFGAGYQLNEHDAAAVGRGGAVVATVKDASAVFFNPAGLTQIEGTQFEAGVFLINPRGEYEGPGLPSTRPATQDLVDQSTATHLIAVPSAYVARALSPKAFVGFGIYAPYGLALQWNQPDRFVGRTQIQEIQLTTIFLTPTIALKLSDQVSVAVSVSLVPASVFLKKTLGAVDNGQVLFPSDIYGAEGTVALSGSAFGVGANAGLQIKLTDNLKLGASYRSAVGLDFSGNADFNVPTTAPASVRANFPDGPVTTSVTLPHSFALGIGWEDTDWTLEATTNLTLWDSNEELRINFESGRPAPSSATPQSWSTSPTLRLGGEYRFEVITSRLGIGYDYTPIPGSTINPILPDANRLLLSAGVGKRFGTFSIDAAYLAVVVSDRRSTGSVNFADGTYKGGVIHVFGASVGLAL